MAISIIPATGKTGSYTFNNATLCIDNWTERAEVDVVDVSNFCSGDYKERAVIRKSASVTIEGVWDLSRNPFAASLKLGLTGILILRINNVVFSTMTAIVNGWRVDDNASSVVRYSIDLVSDGAFTDFSNTAA